MKEIIENKYITYMSFFVIPMGFLADAMGSFLYFIGALLIIACFFFLAYRDNKKMKSLYKTGVVPIPVVINVEHTKSTEHVFDSLIKEIEKKDQFKDLEKNIQTYLNIIRDDLIFKYEGSIYDKAALTSFIQIIRYQLNKIEKNMKNKVEFHLAYYGKPAIGFLVGSIFKDDALVIYQNNPDEDMFNRIAKTYKRNYKTRVNEFEKFNVNIKENKNSEDILIAIKASSHSIDFNTKNLSTYANVISMEANHDGTIGLDEDWILYAREIFSILDSNQSKNITIVHAMPESISVIVGMAIANYWDIQMTQYSDGEYVNLIKLNEIKFYF